jgi:CheY-like chemotaxis protein
MASAIRLEPHGAESVDQALRLVEKWGRPELVITDLQLGERNGLELVVLLRRQFGNELPILVVSGQDDSEVHRQVEEAGATAFVTKPIRRQALFEILQNVMGAKIAR